MTVILNPSTLTPEPSPEILRRLRQVDERLGLKWMEHMECWALTLRWRENDPRRESVQKGLTKLSNAHDIACWFPPDVKADDVPALAEKSMRNHSSQDLRAIAQYMMRYNAEQTDRNLAPVADDLMEQAEVLVGHRAVMTVYQGTDHTLLRASKPSKREIEEMREEYGEDITNGA